VRSLVVFMTSEGEDVGETEAGAALSVTVTTVVAFEEGCAEGVETNNAVEVEGNGEAAGGGTGGMRGNANDMSMAEPAKAQTPCNC
jgi:hypothetical protein